MMYNKDKFMQQRIVNERVEKLLLQAHDNLKEHPELSRRYVVLARKLSTRYKVKFNADQKKKFCKNCNAYLINGINSRVRLEHGKIVQTCLECKTIKRTLYKNARSVKKT